jgi:hypothetical protein
MQFLYGVEPKNVLDWCTINPELNTKSTDEWINQRKVYWNEAMDCISFAQTKMSIYYDNKHKPMSFRPGDKVYITIAKGTNPGYSISNTGWGAPKKP